MSWPMPYWRWTPARTSGDSKEPAPRAAFASAVYAGELFILGGRSAMHEPLTDAFALNINTLRWRQASWPHRDRSGVNPLHEYEHDVQRHTECLHKLSKRHLYAYAALGDTLYLHGGLCAVGCDDSARDVHNELISFSLPTGRLNTVLSDGVEPPRVSRHSLASFGGALWLTGGATSRGGFVSHVYRWTPYPHSSSATSDTSDRDAPKGGWDQLVTSGFEPYPRGLHCFLPAGGSLPYLLLFGGSDGTSEFDDLYSLDTESLVWERIYNSSVQVGTSRDQAAEATEVEPKARSAARCGLLPLSRKTKKKKTAAADDGAREEEEEMKDESLAEGRALLVHGGFDGSGEPHGSAQALPMVPATDKTWTGGAWVWGWMRVTGPSTAGAPRSQHAMHVVDENTVIVFGGAGGEGGDTAVLNDIVIGRPNRLLVKSSSKEEL